MSIYQRKYYIQNFYILDLSFGATWIFVASFYAIKTVFVFGFLSLYGWSFPILWLKVCICLMRPAFLNGLTGLLSIHVNAKVVGCAIKYFRYVEVMWSEMRMNPLFSIHLMDYRILCSPTFCFFLVTSLFYYLAVTLFILWFLFPLPFLSVWFCDLL